MSFQPSSTSPVEQLPCASTLHCNFDSPLSSVLSSGNSSFCASEYSNGTAPDVGDLSGYYFSSKNFLDSSFEPVHWQQQQQLHQVSSDISCKPQDYKSESEVVRQRSRLDSTTSIGTVFNVSKLCLTVRPANTFYNGLENLHNRIFERGETVFGFTEQDQELFMSTIQGSLDSFLDYHFPRKKLEADLRVLPTVYLEDKNANLSLDVSCNAPFYKVLVRSEAFGSNGDCKIEPCSKCRTQSTMFVSLSSFSDCSGQLYQDHGTSALYLDVQKPVSRLRIGLHYNCTHDHIKNCFKLSQSALSNTMTVIEVYGAMNELLDTFTFRVRVVASPGRDLLKFLTNHLTPKQTGCVIGKCSHLGARWKLEKIRLLDKDSVRKCLDRFDFKASIKVELEDMLSKGSNNNSGKNLKRKLKVDVPKWKEEGVHMLDDSCIAVRCSDKHKLARIKETVESMMKDDGSVRRDVPYHHQLISLPANAANFSQGQVFHLITGDKIIAIK